MAVMSTSVRELLRCSSDVYAADTVVVRCDTRGRPVSVYPTMINHEQDHPPIVSSAAYYLTAFSCRETRWERYELFVSRHTAAYDDDEVDGDKPTVSEKFIFGTDSYFGGCRYHRPGLCRKKRT